MTSTTPPPTVIIGIGNSMRGDDGIGPAAIAGLKQTDFSEAPAEVELVCLDGEPARLIEAWSCRRKAIIIDAARAGSAAGSVHRLVVGHNPLPQWSAGTSSHSAGLAEAVELGRTLQRLPEELIVFGVEPANVVLGSGLSPEVSAVLPKLIREVTSEATR